TRPTLFPYTTLFRSRRLDGMERTLSLHVPAEMSLRYAAAFAVLSLRRSQAVWLSVLAVAPGIDAKLMVLTATQTKDRRRCLPLRSEEHTSELQSRGH